MVEFVKQGVNNVSLLCVSSLGACAFVRVRVEVNIAIFVNHL